MLAFGDLSFIENSLHQNYLLSPKVYDWGDVEKVACGPSHMLLYIKDNKTNNQGPLICF